MPWGWREAGRFAVYLEARTAGLGDTRDVGMREGELARIAPPSLALSTRCIKMLFPQSELEKRMLVLPWDLGYFSVLL